MDKTFSQSLQREIFTIPNSIKSDEVARWNLPDNYFFAKGACHILAFTFKELRPTFEIYLIKPHHERGTHVFVTDGSQCFDYQGYTNYADYLQNYADACQSMFEGWSCEVIKIEENIHEFCDTYFHRKPSGFLHDPTSRALAFIKNNK